MLGKTVTSQENAQCRKGFEIGLQPRTGQGLKLQIFPSCCPSAAGDKATEKGGKWDHLIVPPWSHLLQQALCCCAQDGASVLVAQFMSGSWDSFNLQGSFAFLQHSVSEQLRLLDGDAINSHSSKDCGPTFRA